MATLVHWLVRWMRPFAKNALNERMVIVPTFLLLSVSSYCYRALFL